MGQYAAFGAILRRTMADRGVDVRALASALDMDASSVVDWRRGVRLPRVESAAAIADALSAPVIAEAVVRQRTMQCALCGRDFLFNNVGGRRRRYCSQDCGANAWNSERRRVTEKDWGMVHTRWRSRYQKAQAAIEAFCRSCEWDGICKTPDCELRAVSPLPLEKRAAA
jgi:transcriptional regulator with XRE-family HTH domain